MRYLTTVGVSARTVAALQRQGITEPTPVQERTIPSLLAGSDVVIQAPTGSGKTIAFAIPLVERLAGPRHGAPRALIVAPTRELVTQLAGVLRGIDPGLRCAVIFGGVGYGPQIAALRNADVVIGCPGRLLDLAARGAARLDSVEYLVLDEADEMLDAGFAPDVERILALLPGRRQTVLASATMPAWVQTMIARHLRTPERIVVESEGEAPLQSGLVEVPAAEKVASLSRLLTGHDGTAIVFHRTKHGARKLAHDLERLGHLASALQGNLSQNARDRVVADFREQRTQVLVATNVAARGLDVPHVSLVVNFELPDTPDWLTHRVGRTARNGATGRAVTLLTENDTTAWQKLRRLGAPALPRVDTGRLLGGGEWHELASPPITEGDHRGSASGNGRRHSSRPRRGPGRPAGAQQRQAPRPTARSSAYAAGEAGRRSGSRRPAPSPSPRPRG